MTYYDVLTTWLHIASQKGYMQTMDRQYCLNQILHLTGFEQFSEGVIIDEMTLEQATLQLVDFAIKHGKINDTMVEKDALEAKILDVITPLPSQVNTLFWEKWQKSPQEATDYFYQLSCDNGYVKCRDIQKNIQFSVASAYGDMEITINLSKPEKDPKDIAKQRDVVATNYPETALSMSNEGFYGNVHHAARSQHRLIRLSLCDEEFAFQYSPYAYFNEHGILLSQQIRPMAIDKKCFSQLVEALAIFPQYTIGSNADLPIVGGSILSHHHFQLGKHRFPMQQAKEKWQIKLFQHNVSASVVDWPMSVIRLKSSDAHDIVAVATSILQQWQQYSDETVNVIAKTTQPHQTITPIVWLEDNVYVMDLVLRNNRTDEQFPMGIFHAHEDKHHIKKENIGLIEVMGRAILPARLVNEMADVAKFVEGVHGIEQVAEYHREWAMALKEKKSNVSSMQQFVYDEMGQVFVGVLEDCGVFKDELAFKLFTTVLEANL